MPSPFFLSTRARRCPLSDYRVPEVYEQLRGREGEALLELPLAWRNGFRVTGTLHPAFMAAQAFQTTHEKRLLSGNTSRNPEFKFQYFTELPVINSLLALETGHALPEGRAEADARLAPELLRLLDAPNIVVRRLNTGNPAVNPEATLPYLERLGAATRWYESEEYVGLQATLPAAPEQYAWDASHPLARLFFAEGWSALPTVDDRRPTTDDRQRTTGDSFVYAEQREARLLVPSIAAEGAWALSFDSWLPEGLSNRVTILAADPSGGEAVPLDTLALTGTQRHTIVIPPAAPRGPLTELIFRFDQTYPVADLLPDGAPFSLLVESAQEEVGKFAHIYLNGVELAGRGTGYHAATIAPDGSVLDTGHFNTFLDPAASPALAAFIARAPEGSIVALAAEDTVAAGEGTGGLPLGDEVIAALATLGATPLSDLRGDFRWGHALIGVKGGAPGSALEDASPLRPARVFLGAAAPQPHRRGSAGGVHLGGAVRG